MKELIEIQSKLKAPKNMYNSFGKYNYRNCEGIMEAVKPLLHAYECTLTLSDDIAMIGNRYYVRAIATLVNAEGKSVVVTAFAQEPDEKKGMDSAQITGTSSSYARKYALNGLFLIDDTKDPDTDEYKVESDAKAKKAKAQPSSGLNQAVADCNASKTFDELMVVWNKHKELHQDKDFLLAMSTKKKEFQR